MRLYDVTVLLRSQRTVGLLLQASDFEGGGRILDHEVLMREGRRQGVRIAAEEVVRVEWSERLTEAAPVADAHRPAVRSTRACGAALRFVQRVLPSHLREDVLDEWLDETETAAAEGRPVIRRTLSIVLRAAPRIAVTSRIPARARRERG